MTKTAATAFEVRWRKNSDPANLWSTAVPVGADGHVSVPGLERVTDYTFEARAISACGAKSAWVTQTFNLPDVPAGTLTLAGIATEVATAQTGADTANAQLADIASDNILSPAEKPTVMRDYSVITTEQAGIDAQATQYGVTTEKSDYDNAISTLTAYLNTLNSPVPWNNKSGNTDITGSTFKSYFTSVYTTRQTLLNAIYATAKGLADNAQSTANTASNTANTANANTPTVGNPQFSLGLAGWSPDGAGWTAQSTGSPNPQITTCAQFYNGATNAGLYDNTANPCQPGDRFTATGQIKGASGTGNAYVGIAWFNSGKALISISYGNGITGSANGTSRSVGTAPAGTVYCEAVCAVLGYTTGGGGGSYAFTGITLAPQPNSLSETPDGGGRFAAIEPNADQTAGKPLSSLGGRTMDYIGDSATRFAAAQAGADKTSSNTAADTAKVNGVASSSISPIGALMPAEVGAEKTTGKPLSILSGRTMDYIGDSASRVAMQPTERTKLGGVAAGADVTAANPQGSTWLTDSPNLARGGDSMTRFGDRVADNIGETAARKWAAQSGADITTNYAAAGDNMLANPGFESNKVGSIDGGLVAVNGHISDGWTLLQAGMTQTFWYSGSGRTGGRGMLLRVAPGSVLPAGAGYVAFARAISAPIQCSPGDVISVGGYGELSNTDSGGTFGVISRLGLYTADKVGNLTEIVIQDTTTPTAWVLRGPYNYVVPSGVSTVYLQCALFAQNTGVSDATVASTGLAVSFDDLFVTRNDLRSPGSGATVGDQRNLLPVTWAGVRSVLSTSPITFSITAGSPNSTVNFSTTAFTNYGGGPAIPYNAASASHGQVNGTTATYYLFFRDPTSAGGSQTLNVTVFPQTLAQYPDAVLVGSCVVTVASGGGGSGGSGSGGGGLCVADDMFIGEGRPAGDADIGDPFDCIDLPTAAGKHVRALQGVTRGVEACVRVITSDGCALVCSASTPFDLPDGRNTTALHMLGEQVITDLGTATVISLALVGLKPVTRAHLGGVSYAAGADPHRRIYSHNAGVVKP